MKKIATATIATAGLQQSLSLDMVMRHMQQNKDIIQMINFIQLLLHYRPTR